MAMRRAIVRAGLVLAWAAAAGCQDRLPDQDLRILSATPAAKISTDILWKDYQADKTAADKRYWGEAIEITGKVSGVEPTGPPRIMFTMAQTQPPAGIEARLLDDQSTATLAAAKVGERMTLRCFCEGLAGNVILKSCIKP